MGSPLKDTVGHQNGVLFKGTLKGSVGFFKGAFVPKTRGGGWAFRVFSGFT